MVTLEKNQRLPLRLTEDGIVRLADSRVSLASVVHHYKLGASAEQIGQKFPELELATIYATIAYYLNHRDAVEEYLQQEKALSDAHQNEIQSDPQFRKASDELRARLFALKPKVLSD